MPQKTHHPPRPQAAKRARGPEEQHGQAGRLRAGACVRIPAAAVDARGSHALVALAGDTAGQPGLGRRRWHLVYWLYYGGDVPTRPAIHGRLRDRPDPQNIPVLRHAQRRDVAGCEQAEWIQRELAEVDWAQTQAAGANDGESGIWFIAKYVRN